MKASALGRTRAASSPSPAASSAPARSSFDAGGVEEVAGPAQELPGNAKRLDGLRRPSFRQVEQPPRDGVVVPQLTDLRAHRAGERLAQAAQQVDLARGRQWARDAVGRKHDRPLVADRGEQVSPGLSKLVGAAGEVE